MVETSDVTDSESVLWFQLSKQPSQQPGEFHTAMFVFEEGIREQYQGGSFGGPDRRSKPRITEPFLARVRGVDVSGKPFVVDAKLDNLSVSGLHLRLARKVSVGSRLFFIIWLGSDSGAESSSLKVASRGVVVREDPISEVDCGIAVSFTRYRII